jgi:PST family polysaccharide transporter
MWLKNKLDIFGDYLYLGISSLISLIANIIIIKYSVSSYNLELTGIINLVFVILNLIAIIIDYGFNISATKNVIKTDSIVEKSKILFSTILLKFFFFIISLIFIPFILLYYKNDFGFEKTFIWGYTIPFSQVFNVFWFCQAINSIRIFSIVLIFSKLLYIVSVYIFCDKDSFYLINFYFGLFNILSSLIIIYLFLKYKKIQLAIYSNINIYFYLIKSNSLYFASNVLLYFYTNAGMFLTSHFLNQYYVGIYSVCEKVYAALKQFLIIFSSVITPKIFMYLNKKNKKLKVEIIYEYIYFIFGIILTAFFVFIFSHNLSIFFIGKNNLEISNSLIIVGFVILATSLNIPFYSYLLFYEKKFQVFIVFLFCTIILGLFAFILSKIFMLQGIFFSILFSEILMTILFIIISNKLFKKNGGKLFAKK